MNAHKITLDNVRTLADEDVMELLQGGFDQALQVIVERYQSKVQQFICRYTHDMLDAEDLVQETFLRVFRSRHRYERIAKFSTWLYTIAFNLTKSQYKRSSKMLTTSIFAQTEEEQDIERELKSDMITQDKSLELSFCMKHIENALEMIPVEFKDAVIMRDIKNLTYEEIVEISGVPMGTVKSRINRGRARLKVILEKVIPQETIFA
ncbi:MAG: sigma-70 family RNA polymerase sigma factor [Bacteroidetes bacterium]|nr:sigma-70 family RNA polymerase sigma factor [Bacteroidota bacterium]NCQ10708.1 sigma-70 family RNA polymerase sigma factor [Bacteroidota bacterium]